MSLLRAVSTKIHKFIYFSKEKWSSVGEPFYGEMEMPSTIIVLPVTLAECFLILFFFQMVIRNADENAV